MGLPELPAGAESLNNWNSASYGYSNRQMTITVSKTLLLESFEVNALSSADIVLNIGDSTKNYTIGSSGTHLLTVNMELQPGVYDLNLNGTNGPISIQTDGLSNNEVSGVIRFNGDDADDYGFFYNWNISVPQGTCARTPVYAVIDPRNPECTVTGIFNNSETFSFYPNPTTGLIYLSKSMKFEVTNLIGEQVLKSESNIIDLSEHPNGIYLIKTTNRTIRVIKQ